MNDIINNDAIRKDTVKKISLLIFGWGLTIFMVMALGGYSMDKNRENATFGTLTVVVLLLAIGVFMIWHGFGKAKRIQRLKRYEDIIVEQNIKELDEIAKCIGRPIDFVTKDIQRLLNENYFKDCRIDLKQRILIVGISRTIFCSSCGAKNTTSNSKCRFCGSPLIISE